MIEGEYLHEESRGKLRWLPSWMADQHSKEQGSLHVVCRSLRHNLTCWWVPPHKIIWYPLMCDHLTYSLISSHVWPPYSLISSLEWAPDLFVSPVSVQVWPPCWECPVSTMSACPVWPTEGRAWPAGGTTTLACAGVLAVGSWGLRGVQSHQSHQSRATSTVAWPRWLGGFFPPLWTCAYERRVSKKLFNVCFTNNR